MTSLFYFDPEFLKLLIAIAPLVCLLVFVLAIVFIHAFSRSHGLNRRDPSPYSFGGPWTNYKSYKGSANPDFNAEEQPKKKGKNRRRG